MCAYGYHNFFNNGDDDLIELTQEQKDNIIELVKNYARCLWIVNVKQDEIDASLNNIFNFISELANKGQVDLESVLQQERDKLNKVYNNKSNEYDNIIKTLQDKIKEYESFMLGVSVNKDDIINFLRSNKDYGLLEEERIEIAEYIVGLISKVEGK